MQVVPWELFNLILGLAIVGYVLWFVFQKIEHTHSVPDGPADEEYRAYTRAFDLELAAEDVAAILEDSSDDSWRGWTDKSGSGWRDAKALSEQYSTEFQESSPLELPCEADGLALVFLIDQSGSMRGAPIAAVAAAMRFIASGLAQCAVPFEILGYSTAGWHGGRAYQKWKSERQPARPGRLCSLLHIIYKSEDEPMCSDESHEAMLNPDILRENVDGEAIEWACSRLANIDGPRKILIVISDGASVDDATLLHNGPSYLERHLLRVISDIESRCEVTLGAVGIGYDVSRYYSRSRNCDLESIPESIAALIGDIRSATPPSRSEPFTSPSPATR